MMIKLTNKLQHPLFLICLIFIMGIIGVYYSIKIDPLYNANKLKWEQESFLILLKTSDFLHQRFMMGDVEKFYLNGKRECRDKLGNREDFDLTYLQYNWDYVECFLSRWSKKGKDLIFPIQYNTRKYEVVIKVMQRFPTIKVSLGLGDSKENSNKLWIELNPQGQWIALPKGVYSYMLETQQIYYWDNLATDYYTTAKPINWADIRNFNKNWVPEFVSKNSLWAKSASYLTVEQMRSFCQSLEMQLMPTHVYFAFVSPKQLIKPGRKLQTIPLENSYINQINWNGFASSKTIFLEYTENYFSPQENIYNLRLPLSQRPSSFDSIDFVTPVSFRCVKIEETL